MLARMSRLVVLVLAIACNRPAPDAVGSVATAQTATTAATPPSATVAAVLPLVDDATSRTCTVAYGCGLSHPGLGTSMRSTSVDLATCARSSSTSSGPFGHPAAPAVTSSKMEAADCERLRKLVTAVTADDAQREQESAHMDSEACSLTVTCGGAQKINVQRQSASAGPVGQLIRAVR